MAQCWSSVEKPQVLYLESQCLESTNLAESDIALISGRQSGERECQGGVERTEASVGLDLEKAPQGSKKDLDVAFKRGRVHVGG